MNRAKDALSFNSDAKIECTAEADLYEIMNDVVIGTNDELFLAGGAHSPWAYASGEMPVRPHLFDRFSDNISRRSKFSEKSGAKYLHFVAPDKHNVVVDDFPIKDPIVIGKCFLENCGDTFIYPAERMKKIHREFRMYDKTDTHWSNMGSIESAIIIAEYFSIPNYIIDSAKSDLISSIKHSDKETSGDLGSKIIPVMTENISYMSVDWDVKIYSNGVKNNNGKMIYIYSSNKNSKGKLLLFCDSFILRNMWPYTAFFEEILFCRTPYYHREMVQLYNPDYIITEQAERYLTSLRSDREAPPFLMLFGNSENPASYKDDAKEILSTVLSSKRGRVLNSHRDRFRTATSDPAGLNGNPIA